MLRDDAAQLARLAARLPHGHGNAHLRAVGGIDPGVIRNRESSDSGFLSFKVLGDNPAVECLAQAVGGDETRSVRNLPVRTSSAALCHQYIT
jgi:hypothetical protein